MSVGRKEVHHALSVALHQLERALAENDANAIEQATTNMGYYVRKVRVQAPSLLVEYSSFAGIMELAAKVAYVDLSEDDDGDIERQLHKDLRGLKQLIAVAEATSRSE